MILHWHVSCSFLELLELMQNVKCGVFEKSKEGLDMNSARTFEKKRSGGGIEMSVHQR